MAERLNYRPNAAAKATATGRFCAVGMLARCGIGPIQDVVNAGVHDALQEAGRRMVYSLVDPHALRRGGPPPQMLREMAVDGALVHFARDVPTTLMAGFDRCRMPVAFINTRGRHDCVLPDDREATHRLTRRLIEMGHCRIGYSTTCADDADSDPLGRHYSVAERLEGYEAAMTAAQLEPCVLEPVASDVPLSERLDSWAVTLARHSHVTAWIAYHTRDVGAIVAAASARGWSVPRDLSVATFRFEANVYGAGGNVSTMRIPFYEVGRQAVEMLLQRIKDPSRQLPSIRVPFSDVSMETIALPNETRS